MSWDELVQLLYSSPQYVDPSAAGLGGKTVSQDVSLLRQLEELTGTPILELLGGNFQEFVPHESDTGRIYGSDPMFGTAFSNIANGADPVSVLNDIVSNPSKYGIPDGTKVGDDEWRGRTFSVLEDFAKEHAAAARYNAENGGTYKVGSETFSGDPHIFDRRSQYELMGEPSVDDLLKEYAERYVDERFAGQDTEPTPYDQWIKAPENALPPPAREGYAKVFPTWTVPAPPQKTDRIRTDMSPAFRGAEDRKYLAYVAEMEKAPMEARRRLGLDDPDSAASRAYRAAYEAKVTEAQSTSVPSDAERKLVQQIMMLRGVIGR